MGGLLTGQLSIRITPSIATLTPAVDIFTQTSAALTPQPMSSNTVSYKMTMEMILEADKLSLLLLLCILCSCLHLPTYQWEELVLVRQMPELHGSRSLSQLEQASSLLCQQLCALLSRIHTERDACCDERRDRQVRTEWNPPSMLCTSIINVVSVD